MNLRYVRNYRLIYLLPGIGTLWQGSTDRLVQDQSVLVRGSLIYGRFYAHGNISELCPFMLKLMQNFCNFDTMYDI